MKKFLSILSVFVLLIVLATSFVGCSKNKYSGKTYKLSEIKMLNNNGSEDTFEEYLNDTGITEKQIEKIKSYYGISISDTTSMKAFLLKYVFAEINFIDDTNLTFSYGFNTVENSSRGVIATYSYDGTYEVLNSGLSIYLNNYQYLKNGEIDEDEEGIYKSIRDTKILGTMYGDLSFNISLDGKLIVMDLYKTLFDGTKVNYIKLIFSKV